MEVSAGADTMEADQEKRFDAEQDNQVEDEAGVSALEKMTSIMTPELLNKILRNINSDLEIDEAASLHLTSLLEEAVGRVLRECVKDVTFPSTASVDSAFYYILTPKSKFGRLSLNYARNKTNAYLANPAISDINLPVVLVQELVQAATLADGVATSDVPSITECAAYITAALEYLYIELLKGCQSQLWNNQFNRRGAVSTRITTDVVDLALNAKAEWPRLFVEPPPELVDTTLTVRIALFPAKGDAIRYVTLDSAQTVGALCTTDLKAKLGMGANTTPYCLFLVGEESDEFHGIFLDPLRKLNSYPTVRADSLLEYRPEMRTQLIYTSESKGRDLVFNENMSVEQVVKMLINKLGLRDHHRFGLLLVSDDFNSGSSSNLSSGSSTTLRSGSSTTVNASNSGTLFGPRRSSEDTYSAMTVNKRLAKGRPISQAYIIGADGISRAGRGAMAQVELPSNYKTTRKLLSPAMFSSSAPPSNLSEALIIETTDRTDWLNPHQALRALNVLESDVLLLVRQKKHLTFFDEVNENPLRSCEKMRERAEALIRQMTSLLADVNAYKIIYQEVSSSLKRELSRPFTRRLACDVWIAGQSYQAAGRDLDDYLSYRADDKVVVLHKQPTKWYGVLHNSEGWFDQTKGKVIQALGSRPGGSAPMFISVPAASKPTPTSSSSSHPATSGTTLARSATTGGTGSNLRDQLPHKPHEGFLNKKGQRFSKWKRKYYRVFNRSLCSYNSESDSASRPLSQLSLEGVEVGPVTSGKDRAANTFFVRDGNGKERVFMAGSGEDMHTWIESLRTGMQGQRSVIIGKK